MSDVPTEVLDDGGLIVPNETLAVSDPHVSTAATSVPAAEDRTDATIEEIDHEITEGTTENIPQRIETNDRKIERNDVVDDRKESSSSSFTTTENNATAAERSDRQQDGVTMDSPPPKGDEIRFDKLSDETKEKSAAEDTDTLESMQIDSSSSAPKIITNNEGEKTASIETTMNNFSGEKQEHESNKIEKKRI